MNTSLKIPELNEVRGAMNLQSSEDIQDVCDNFSSMASSNGVIRGKFTCKSNNGDPKTLSEGGGSGSSTGSGSDTSGNAASTRYISGATGVMGVIAAIFGML